MRKLSKFLIGAGVLVLLWAPPVLALSEIEKFLSEDPAVYEEDIAAFEAQDALSPPPANPIVFVGSSSIRRWQSLAEDMAPMVVMNRGFGGAKILDAIHYADRIVTVYQPKAVVVFVGSNDIFGDVAKEPALLRDRFVEFVNKVRAGAPDAPIYNIAITPSKSRWEHWSRVQETNALIQEVIDTDPALHMIDTNAGLLEADGTPNPEMYVEDELHLSALGYAHWVSVIKPILMRDLTE